MLDLSTHKLALALDAAGLAGASLQELETAAIFNALARCQDNRTHASAMLGISVRTLQRKLRRLDAPYRETA
jgi:DNA-binding NtrC family response regulator